MSARFGMGTGYSSAFGVPIASSSVAGAAPGFLAGAAPGLIAGAAEGLARVNAQQQSLPPHSIAGYRGPTIPDLKTYPQVNDFAQQVLSVIYSDIPALAPHRNARVPASIPAHNPGVYPEAYVPRAPGAVQPQQLPPAPPLFSAPASLPPPGGPVPAPPPAQPLLGDPLRPPADAARQQLDALQQQLDQLRQAQAQQNQQQAQDVDQVSSSVSLDDLLTATIKFKQYTALDFVNWHLSHIFLN